MIDARTRWLRSLYQMDEAFTTIIWDRRVPGIWIAHHEWL